MIDFDPVPRGLLPSRFLAYFLLTVVLVVAGTYTAYLRGWL